jgi:hypothetical protein
VLEDMYWFLVTEEAANYASLLCLIVFAFFVFHHIKYSYYSRKFRKITKSDYPELFETCRVGDKYSIESDSLTYMRYKSRKVYKQTNNQPYIEFGEKLHRIYVIHKWSLIAFCVMFVFLIYFYGEIIRSMD